MSWDELTAGIEENFTGSSHLCITSSFSFFENNHLEFLLATPHPWYFPMDRGIKKNLKTLYCTKLVNYILETIGENLPTSSSAAKEVSARTCFISSTVYC
jgi:hypothetical protein